MPEAEAEHALIKNFTTKNLITTVVSTAMVVISVMGTYTKLSGDIRDIKNTQDTETRVNNIRIGVIEGQIALLQQQVNALKDERNDKKVSSNSRAN